MESSQFYISFLSYTGINIILALGLNVIIGSIGQIHLGWGAYAGAGAYITAYLLKIHEISFWVGLPLSIIGGGIFGTLTGLPALRVRGDFLAILSIGIVFIFETLMIYLPWFGGPSGIDYIPRPIFFGTEIGNLGLGLLILAFVIIIIFVCFKINRSWIGLAWECIRLDEETAQINGINVGRYKLIAFVVGGLFSGLGGALYSTFFRHICPHDFSFTPSLEILAMVVVGGTGTVSGPIAGAVLFTLLPEIFRFVQDYRNLIYGGSLVLVIMYAPSGLFGRESYLRNFSKAFVKRGKIK